MQPANLAIMTERINKVGIRRWLLEQLVTAFVAARKGKLKTHDENEFEQNWIENLILLRDSIIERRYQPSASVAFVVYEPMIREIFAAPFRDRVVHHFLYSLQAGWWDRRFIYDSYSCRVGKGTLFGVKRAQKIMRQVTNGYSREAMVIKMDIRGYFMSLPRDQIFNRVKWGLDQQFKDYLDDRAGRQIYKICKFLWKQVLFDDPVEKAHRKGPLKNWDPEVLPREKSLFSQPPRQGIVIGNLTSQTVSNIYLDALDRFVKFKLGYKYYGRYVDDFFIMVPIEQYEQAKKDVAKIREFLKDELGLKLHPRKFYAQSVYKGMSFLGARIYPHCLYPSDRLQANFKRKVSRMACGYGEIDGVSSYIGMMSHLDSKKLVQEVFEKVGWGYTTDMGEQ